MTNQQNQQQTTENPTEQTSSSSNAGSLELPDVESVLAEAEAAVGQCCVMHGSFVQYANIAGQTVSEVRSTFRSGWSISDKAKALVRGKEVDENYQLLQGETLEFAKQSGVKG